MHDGDKTVVVLGDRHQRLRAPLRIQYPGRDGSPLVARFAERLVVGRDPGCDIRLEDQGISRRHLEIYPDTNGWWVRDLGSSNGTYLNGRRIQQSQLPTQASIRFFDGGPVIKVSREAAEASPESADRYLDQPTPAPPVTDSDSTRSRNRQHPVPEPDPGPHRDIEHMARRHRRRFTVGMSIMALLLTAALGVIFYQYHDREEMLTLASEIFYQAKSLELELSRLKQQLSARPGTGIPASVRETSQRLSDMQQRYASFTEEMKLIGSYRSKEDLLIFRIARVFGEYDLSIPDDFIQEVKRYIRKWQQSGRLAQTMSRINANGQGKSVALAMLERDLPPQFLYLAVQESDFRTDAIGPMTRFGIPKGMWQFLPQTAAEYGLTVGPQRDKRIFDPADDRFDFHKSTGAAADYLRFLYSTDAQGSGLLVMSAYNWGQSNLRRKLKRLPQNPAQRNFWRLLQSQQIPDETYGYVLGIVAAAVIGEDPKQFGFSFKNPLADL